MSTENLTELIKAIGLVVAGLWAAWSFFRLQKVRAAELKNNKRLIETHEIQSRLLSSQPVLGVNLTVGELPSPDEKYRSILSVTVVLTNQGTQNLRVDFATGTLTSAKVNFDKGVGEFSDIQYFEPQWFGSANAEPLPCRIMKVGQMRETVLATIPISEPSAYLFQFFADYYREPFDEEEPTGGATVHIQAIEQKFFVATGTP